MESPPKETEATADYMNKEAQSPHLAGAPALRPELAAPREPWAKTETVRTHRMPGLWGK